jgi:hypothetical protein
MSKSTILSPTLVATKKEAAIKAQTLNKKVNIGAITIIDENHLEINGIKIQMLDKAFGQLIKALGLPKGFTDELTSLFNKKSKVAFINKMSTAISMMDKSSSVNVILSPTTKRIVGFTKSSNIISNETFFELADKITAGQGLGVTNILNHDSGISTINLKLDKQTEIKGLTNEAFKPGLTLSNIPGTGIQVSPFMERLWCANGCTTSMVKESYQLEDLSSDGMNKFFDHIKSLRANNFIPSGYGDMVRGADATPASIREVDNAYRIIKNATDSADIADKLTQRSRNYNAYSAKNIDFTGRKNLAESNQSVWSLVNAITYVGSNSENLGLESPLSDDKAGQVQVQAGAILTSQHDLKTRVDSPFNGLNKDHQVGLLMN